MLKYDLKNDDPEKQIDQDPLGIGREQKEYCSISDTVQVQVRLLGPQKCSIFVLALDGKMLFSFPPLHWWYVNYMQE